MCAKELCDEIDFLRPLGLRLLAEEEKKSSGLAQENEQLKDKISRLKSKSAADKQAFHAVLVEDEEKLEDAYKDADLAGDYAYQDCMKSLLFFNPDNTLNTRGLDKYHGEKDGGF